MDRNFYLLISSRAIFSTFGTMLPFILERVNFLWLHGGIQLQLNSLRNKATEGQRLIFAICGQNLVQKWSGWLHYL